MATHDRLRRKAEREKVANRSENDETETERPRLVGQIIPVGINGRILDVLRASCAKEEYYAQGGMHQ
jgi:hypothetical protein